jgi:autotransporter-associated beta strand protein
MVCAVGILFPHDVPENRMHPIKKIALVSIGSLSLFAGSHAVAQSIFDASSGSNWMKPTNWNGGNPPGVSDIAEFGSAYSSGSNGIQASPFGPNITATNATTDLGTSTTSLGGTAGTAGAEDVNTEAVGAISAISGLSKDFYIGNPTPDPSDFLELNGATVNSIASTIISNTSAHVLTIEGTYTGQANPMGVVLGNTTNVIQGSGTTVVSANIYERSTSAMSIQGGSVTLSGANQYSGGTTVTSGALIIGNTAGLGSGAMLVAGGTLSATVANVSVGGTLTLGSGSIALSANSSPTLQLALNQNFVMTGGTLSLALNSGGQGSIGSAGGSGGFEISGGTLNLNNGITNYGTSYDLLSGFNSADSSVAALAITGYDTADYTANLGDNGVLTFAATPEPNVYLLFLVGAALLAGWRTRRAVALGCVAVVGMNLGGRAMAQEFTPGNIVVSVYGAGGTGMGAGGVYEDGQATPITLEEFGSTIAPDADAGAPIITDTLPTADGVDGSSNVGVVGEYGSSSEGTLELSGNGEYLTIGGYSATQSDETNGSYGGPVGGYSTSTTALAQSTDANVPRVAVLIDANGDINSSTVLNDVYNTQNIRGVYTTDGSDVYVSGQSVKGDMTTQGVFYTATGTNTTAGGSAPAQVYGTVSTREVEAYGGNLYFSTDQHNSGGDVTGVFEYSGLPTGPGAMATQILPSSLMLNGGTVNLSPQGLYFANATTLYVADTGIPKAGGTGDGGIQKWTLSGGTWTLNYTITSPNFVATTMAATATSGQTGFESITGMVVGTGSAATVDLYAVSYTAGDDNPNGLYGVSDTLDATTLGMGETTEELATAPGDGGDNFKGVSFTPEAVPEPPAWVLLGAAFLGLAWFQRRRKVDGV